MTNYCIIVRNAQPDEIATAEVVTVDNAQFDAITAIITRVQSPLKRIQVTWASGATIRADHYITATSLGFAALNTIYSVSDSWPSPDGLSEWVRIPEGWIARVYNGSVRAVYIQ